MNKKYIVIGIVVIIIVGIVISLGNKKTEIVTDTGMSTSTPKETISTSTPEVKEVKVSLLESKPYINNDSKFSLYLPKGWKLLDKSSSETESNDFFTNGSSTLVVKRYIRGEASEKAIAFMGEEEFHAFLADQLKEDIKGYAPVSTSTVMINGVKYYKVIGGYTGGGTKKPVTHYAYITVLKDSYYIIGADVYTELWATTKDSLLGSISTLKLL